MNKIKLDTEERLLFEDTETYDSNGLNKNSIKTYRTEIDIPFNIHGVHPGEGKEKATIESSAWDNREDRINVEFNFSAWDGSNSGSATLHFSSIEKIDELADALKKEFFARKDIIEARKELKEQGYIKHPGSYITEPTLMQRAKIETGKYYWDIDALEPTAAFAPEEYNHEEGDWYSEKAHKIIDKLENSCETFPELNLDKLSTRGTHYLSSYGYGITNHKVRLETDKRRKKKVCTLRYADGSTKTIDGHWELWNGNFQEVSEW